MGYFDGIPVHKSPSLTSFIAVQKYYISQWQSYPQFVKAKRDP